MMLEKHVILMMINIVYSQLTKIISSQFYPFSPSPSDHSYHFILRFEREAVLLHLYLSSGAVLPLQMCTFRGAA